MPSLTNGERRNSNITSNPAQVRRSRKDVFGSLNSGIGSLRPPRNGRTLFAGKAGPTGVPHAVDGIGLPSGEEHSDDDQGGEGADEPDHNGDFLQSFHENLLLQPWSAVTRRERLPLLHEPVRTA